MATVIKNTRNGRYEGFDGLRGISILLVIISHLGFWSNFPPDIAARVIPVLGANAGVNLFFVISGFLITAILLKEKCDYGSISVRLFIIRRVLRLMPAFLLFVVVIGLLMSSGLIQSSGLALLLSAFYLYNFVPYGHLYTSELAHTWSLAIEEHFYLIWPWLVAKFEMEALYKLAIKMLLICFVGYILVSGIKYRWTIPGVAPILVGCLISIYHFGLSPRRLFRWKPSDKVIGMAALLLWILPLFVPPSVYKLVYLPQICGFGLIVYWVFRNSCSRVVKVLELRPLVYIGTISYGLYLWQGLFVTNGPGGKLWIQHFPQNIFLTLAAAMLSYHFFEKHFLRIKKRFVRDSFVTCEHSKCIQNA